MFDWSLALSQFLLVLLAATGETIAAASNITQPHIILIIVDDLGFNDVPWHNPSVLMPNIEKLAREGVILEQSYVQAVCTPTRAALLTGRYPYTIGRQSSALKPLRPTGLSLNVSLLPEVLREAGYNTHMVGKWHLGFCKWEYTPTFRGFDSFLGYYVGSQGYYNFKRTHTVKDKTWVRPTASGYDMRLNTEPYYPPERTYSTFMYSERAQEIILSHDSSRPLFLYLPFQAVHGPLEAPQKYTDLYSHIHDTDRRVYFAMLSALDDAVGAITGALKSRGLYDNSVIAFSSDNGGAMNYGGNNWPLKGHKSTLWEGGTRTPAFIHSPLLEQPGRTYNGLFHVVDWLPTLAGLTGALVPKNLDGLDQFPSLSTGATPMRDTFIYNIDEVRGRLKAAVRVGDFKLIIGETRGNYWIPPPEIANDDAGRRRKLAPQSNHFERRDRFLTLPFGNDSEYNSFQGVNAENTQDFVDRFLTLPFGNDTVYNSFQGVTAENTQDFVDRFLTLPFGNDSEYNSFQGVNAENTQDFVDRFLTLSFGNDKVYNSFQGVTAEKTQDFVDRFLTFPFGNDTEYNSFQGVKAENTQVFEPPFFTAYDHDFIEEEGVDNLYFESDAFTGDSLDCEGLTRKQCRKNKRQLSTFASFSRVEDFFVHQAEMRLYDLTRDPNEKHDLSKSDSDRVRTLLRELLKEIPRAVLSDNPTRVEAGNPTHFGGVWSPGWC